MGAGQVWVWVRWPGHRLHAPYGAPAPASALPTPPSAGRTPPGCGRPRGRHRHGPMDVDSDNDSIMCTSKVAGECEAGNGRGGWGLGAHTSARRRASRARCVRSSWVGRGGSVHTCMPPTSRYGLAWLSGSGCNAGAGAPLRTWSCAPQRRHCGRSCSPSCGCCPRGCDVCGPASCRRGQSRRPRLLQRAHSLHWAPAVQGLQQPQVKGQMHGPSISPERHPVCGSVHRWRAARHSERHGLSVPSRNNQRVNSMRVTTISKRAQVDGPSNGTKNPVLIRLPTICLVHVPQRPRPNIRLHC